MSKIINYSLAQLGKPYVFGTSGPNSFDCSGLTKAAGRQINLDLYHGATTQWLRGTETGIAERYGYFDKTGTIDTLPMDRVAFLFNQDKTKSKFTMAHVGFYDGKGRIIQCGGFGGKGVHENPFNRKWFSHWATLSPFWAERDGDGFVDTSLRQGSIGENVRQLQLGLMALGYDVGKSTQADGKFGPATATAVRKFQADEGLDVTGVWSVFEQNALDNALEDENGAPVNDDAPPVDNDALKAEARGLLMRLGAILDNL